MAKFRLPSADRSLVTTLAASQGESGAVREGRGWRYIDGYLVNEYLGRVGHTPAWIVEIEGEAFHLPRPKGIFRRLVAYWKKPRIVQRNRRRLAFVWPLAWPPPNREERARLVATAVDRARTMGRPTGAGCGVCRGAGRDLCGLDLHHSRDLAALGVAHP